MSHLCDMSARADIRAVTAENVRCALLLLSSKGQHCPFAGDNERKIRRKCCYRHTLIRARSVLCQLNSLSRIRPCLLAWAHLIRRLSATPSPRNTVTFGQVRKALLYIKILCQHNRSRAKSNSDHQNSYFAAMPAAGATIGIRFRGNARRRRDHRNSYFTGMPTVRRSSGCRRRLCRE